jgi:hypothetical protein
MFAEAIWEILNNPSCVCPEADKEDQFCRISLPQQDFLRTRRTVLAKPPQLPVPAWRARLSLLYGVAAYVPARGQHRSIQIAVLNLQN